MRAPCDSSAIDRLEREAAEVLVVDELLRRRPALWWLADAFAARLLRLGSALDSARRGWPPC
jgi:hypothetical protein